VGRTGIACKFRPASVGQFRFYGEAEVNLMRTFF